MPTDRFKFDIIGKEFKTQALNCMRTMAMANKNYFLKTFKVQGWDSEQWKEVNRRIAGTKEYKYPAKKGLRRRTRPILVGKGSLRRAVNSSIKSVSPTRVRFVVDLPYAAIHNEGLRMRNGAPMPRRQYMGQNKETDRINKDIIKKYADKAFRQ